MDNTKSFYLLNVGSIPARGARLCGCAAEWLGDGLQIRTMQVRSLSPTPDSSCLAKLVDV
jgi:hypothetical protein